MAKQTFTTGAVLTAAQMNSLQSNDFNQTVSLKTASYTLVAADKGTRIEFNTSGSVTCTVNTGLFDAGDTLIIQNRGAGAVTVTAGTATVNTEGSLVINQYGSGILYFISASASILFAGAAGDITGVTAGTGLTGGGSSGTVTLTNDMAVTITAKGDLLVGTGNATYDNLAVGTNGYTLVADSSETTGLKWAAAAAGGKVLQVVNGTRLTQTSTTSTSFVDTNLSATITPSSASSQILVTVHQVGLGKDSGATSSGLALRLMRDSTEILVMEQYAGLENENDYLIFAGSGCTYLDSPATTSAITYKTQFKSITGSTVFTQYDNSDSTITLMEIGA